jgi:threonine dehydratase
MAVTAPPATADPSTPVPIAGQIPAQIPAGIAAIGMDEIERAAGLLRDVAVPTPVMPCPLPDWAPGATAPGQLWLKCESLQRTGSFKLRGAFVRIARLGAAARRRGVVTASAGNHAQGVALAAASFGIPATVFMPSAAPAVKIDATRALGATVELVDGPVDNALERSRQVAAERGLAEVHPFDDPDVIAGQGTIGLELAAQLPEIGTVLVPVGGGGLLAGVAAAVKAVRPGVQVIGVQADGAAAFAASLAAGRRVTLAGVETIADGIRVARPGALPLGMAASGLVDAVVSVADEVIWKAMRHCWAQLRLIAEPAGAAGLAGLALAGTAALGPLPGPVVAVVSGGNIDHQLGARLLG